MLELLIGAVSLTRPGKKKGVLTESEGDGELDALECLFVFPDVCLFCVASGPILDALLWWIPEDLQIHAF